MNFQEFQQFRADLLQRDRAIIDLAETNLWRSLKSLVPELDEQPQVYIHRCHLAEAWLDRSGLPATWSKFALISSGVRHSLTLLLPELAKQNRMLLMPLDVYPVYGQIAEASGLHPLTFSTIPQLSFPDQGDWLLMPNPLKPAGRWLDEDEVKAICDWLERDPRRRLLIDSVYDFQNGLHETTRTLLETRQALLMHSLSKAWLHPKIMGVCITPEADWDDLAPIFRANSPEQSSLQIASQLLRAFPTLPQTVDGELQVRRERLMKQLPKEFVYSRVATRIAGYFVPLKTDFEYLLREYKILTIPLSVFGSAQPMSIASCL
jgi:aspartate/methionine/tyrosine aminotransferase